MTACREYQGTIDANGYGRRQEREVRARFGTTLVHRQIMIMAGHDLDGLNINHHCDNPSCFRYDHLYIGTQKENIADMIRRGRRRSRGAVGEAHHNAVVTDDDVRYICASTKTAEELAEQFGITPATIRNFINGTTRNYGQEATK